MTTASKLATAAGALAVLGYVTWSGVIFFNADAGTSNDRYVPGARQPVAQQVEARQLEAPKVEAPKVEAPQPEARRPGQPEASQPEVLTPEARQPNPASDDVPDDDGGVSLAEVPSGVTVREAEGLLGALGDVLAQLDRSPWTVMDVSKLPTTKARMRAAVLTYMKASRDPTAFDYFKAVYPRLAYFQPGIGETPVALNQPGPDGKPWSQVIEQEQRALLSELAGARR